MTEEEFFATRFHFPCPNFGCNYNVVTQAIQRTAVCPECGAKLPLIPAGHRDPDLAWESLTGRTPKRRPISPPVKMEWPGWPRFLRILIMRYPFETLVVSAILLSLGSCLTIALHKARAFEEAVAAQRAAELSLQQKRTSSTSQPAQNTTFQAPRKADD
jgi:hypothetical protein